MRTFDEVDGLPELVTAALRGARGASGETVGAAASRLGITKLKLDLLERGVGLPSPDVADNLVAGFVLPDEVAAALRGAAQRWRPPMTRPGGGVCLVITRGRRTGKERVKEWSFFVLHGGNGPCFLEPAGARANWVRNLIADPHVTLVVDDGVFEGFGYVPTDPDEAEEVRERFRLKYAAQMDAVVDELIRDGTPVVVTESKARFDAVQRSTE